MSKTVAELAREIGISKQYLNRILSQNNLGRKKGNKKLVSEMDEKILISILEGNIGNKKSETKIETQKTVSDTSSISSSTKKESYIGNQKTETEIETSFRYIHEQLEIKVKEVERLHQLLDQSQQLLLNEQKKNQLLLENKSEATEWKKEKQLLENSIEKYHKSYNNAIQKVSDYYEWAKRTEKLFCLTMIVAGILLILLLVLVWFYIF